MKIKLEKQENLVPGVSASLAKLLASVECNHIMLQKDIAALVEENKARREEIKEIAQGIGKITTDDECLPHPSPTEDEDDEPRPRSSTWHDSRVTPSAPPVLPRSSILAKDVVRTIRSLRGRNDTGVEDFISSVKAARTQCGEDEFLLRLIIAKITERAERNIRHLSIVSYEELYDALRKHVAPATTVANARSKLKEIKQGNTESIHSYNLRFRQQYSELCYAIQ